MMKALLSFEISETMYAMTNSNIQDDLRHLSMYKVFVIDEAPHVHIKFWMCITCVLLIIYEVVVAVFICFKHFITQFIIIYDQPSFRVYYQVCSCLSFFLIKLLAFTVLYNNWYMLQFKWDIKQKV